MKLNLKSVDFLQHEELVKAMALSANSGSAMESKMVMLVSLYRIPGRFSLYVTQNR